jgi:DNA-binding PadR family transcriptional regulator
MRPPAPGAGARAGPKRKAHDARSLLLLGLLLEQRRHGYRLHEDMARNLRELALMKKPTAYALLDRLRQDGYVAARGEPGERRAERRVYAITPAGKRLLRGLLRQALSEHQPIAVDLDIGLLFIAELPPREARACLERRLGQAEAHLALHEGLPAAARGRGAELALAHYCALLRADRDWLAATVQGLRTRAGGEPAADR